MIKKLSLRNLQLFYNVISEAEEKVLMEWVDPLMKRRRYEGSHWDDVISRYKEVDTASYRRSDDVANLLGKVQRLVQEHMHKVHADSASLMSPHLIDLAPDGYIAAHVDSIKFSGDLVAGLSMQSTRAMVLTRDVDSDPQMLANSALLHEEMGTAVMPLDTDALQIEQPITNEFPTKLTVILPPRSLYIMQGVWRYQYGHAVSLPLVDGRMLASTPDNAKLFTEPTQRRVSIIFRNILSEHDKGRRL